MRCAERVGFDGSTSVFTKRRYRDKWNRTVVRRVAKGHKHTLKVKGKCRPKGARGQFYSESKAQHLRRRARTQALFNLLLAGDFHAASETKDLPMRPHTMRVMLVSNLAVDQRFANGTQDRGSNSLHHHGHRRCCRQSVIVIAVINFVSFSTNTSTLHQPSSRVVVASRVAFFIGTRRACKTRKLYRRPIQVCWLGSPKRPL